MESVFGVLVGVVIAVAAIVFGNWFGSLFFSLFRLAGAAVSLPFTRFDRLAPVGLLSLAGAWGWLFNNIFILALIIAVAGTFLSWGIAAGASTVSWAAFAIACLLYFVGGIGEGTNRGQKLRVLTAAGFTPKQVDLLNRNPQTLTPEELAIVNAEREAVVDHFNVHPALRGEVVRQGQAPAAAHDELDVIAAYGAVLEAVSTAREPHAVYPESRLPFPKPVIEGAIKAALEYTTDAQLRDQLQVGLVCLQDFVPDDEVESNPREQAMQHVHTLRRELGIKDGELRQPVRDAG